MAASNPILAAADIVITEARAFLAAQLPGPDSPLAVDPDLGRPPILSPRPFALANLHAVLDRLYPRPPPGITAKTFRTEVWRAVRTDRTLDRMSVV